MWIKTWGGDSLCVERLGAVNHYVAKDLGLGDSLYRERLGEGIQYAEKDTSYCLSMQRKTLPTD